MKDTINMTESQIAVHKQSDELTMALQAAFSFDDVQYEFIKDSNECIVFVTYDILAAKVYKGITIECNWFHIPDIIEDFKTAIMTDEWDDTYTIHENTNLLSQIMHDCGFTGERYAIARNVLLFLFEAYDEQGNEAVYDFQIVTDLSDVKKIEIVLDGSVKVPNNLVDDTVIALTTANSVISIAKHGYLERTK